MDFQRQRIGRVGRSRQKQKSDPKAALPDMKSYLLTEESPEVVLVCDLAEASWIATEDTGMVNTLSPVSIVLRNR
jgi:hypothetical protein